MSDSNKYKYNKANKRKEMVAGNGNFVLLVIY